MGLPAKDGGMHTSSGTSVAAGALRFGGGIGVGMGDGHGACAAAGEGVNAANSPRMAAVQAHVGTNLEWRAQPEASCMTPPPTSLHAEQWLGMVSTLHSFLAKNNPKARKRRTAILRKRRGYRLEAASFPFPTLPHARPPLGGELRSTIGGDRDQDALAKLRRILPASPSMGSKSLSAAATQAALLSLPLPAGRS